MNVRSRFGFTACAVAAIFGLAGIAMWAQIAHGNGRPRAETVMFGDPPRGN